MKKVIIGIVALLAMLPFVVSAKDKVQVYVYTKDGCGYCEQEISELNALAEEHGDLFDAHVIEIFDGSWNFNGSALEQLLQKTYEAYGEDMDQVGTPINAIGDFFASGYLDRDGLLEKINEAKGQKDRVAPILDELGLDVNEITKDNAVNNDVNTVSSASGNGGVIAISIISALLVILVYLVKSHIDKKEILEAIKKRK